MDYTLSDGFVTDAGTGNRMHLQAQAVPTAVSDGDLNGLIWEALSVIKAAGIVPTAFNKATASTYTQLLTALRLAGVFATPSQFDNTTKAATTAFVQRAIGNLSGLAGINATGTLAVADLGKFIDVSCLTAGQTISLPTSASAPAGSLYYIRNSGNPYILSGTAAETLTVDGSVSTTHAIGSGGQIVAVSSGGVGWHISGTGVLGKLGDFGSSLAASGYQKLPSGLIIQWGAVTATSAGAIVTFPIAFPTTCATLTTGVGVNSNGAVDSTEVTYITTTSFTAYGLINGGGANVAVRWMAIGY